MTSAASAVGGGNPSHPRHCAVRSAVWRVVVALRGVLALASGESSELTSQPAAELVLLPCHLSS